MSRSLKMLFIFLKFVVLLIISREITADLEFPDLPPEKDPSRPSIYWWANATAADEQLFECFMNMSLPPEVSKFLYDVADDVFREENSTNIRRLFNVTMLDWYCEFASKVMHCVDECPDGRWKNYVPRFYTATNYVCNGSDFIERSKCYHDVYQADVDECESGDKCLPYKMSSWHLIEKAKNKTHNLPEHEEIAENVRNMLQYTCDYITCGNRCRQDELVGKCGEQGNNVLLEFYRRVIGDLKSLVTFFSYIFADRDFQFADNCDAI